MSQAAMDALFTARKVIQHSHQMLGFFSTRRDSITDKYQQNMIMSLQDFLLAHVKGLTVVTITPEMMDVLVAAERSLPEMAWDANLVPWPTTFVHFQKCIAMVDPPEYPQDVSQLYDALGWDIDPPYVALGWTNCEPFLHTGDTIPIAGTSFSFFTETAGIFSSNMGLCLQNGEELEDREHHPMISATRFVTSLALLLGQRIALPNRVYPLRAGCRQWTRSLSIEVPEIIEITLRRPAREGGPESGTPNDVNWSHQWIVGGHWRNQYLRSTGAYRPTWIAPYIKGPDDKPLVVKERVYRLER